MNVLIQISSKENYKIKEYQAHNLSALNPKFTTQVWKNHFLIQNGTENTYFLPQPVLASLRKLQFKVKNGCKIGAEIFFVTNKLFAFQSSTQKIFIKNRKKIF